MSKPLFLTLDLGTSSSRAVIFDGRGGLVWAVSEPHFPEGGGDEGHGLDANLVEERVVRLLRNAAAAVPVPEVAGIGVSAQLGLALLNTDGLPLGPLTTWMDRRATDEARRLADGLGAERIYQVTGRRPDPELMACKLLRLRIREPEVFTRLRWVLSLKDYILFLLTGTPVTDPAHASYSMLADVARGEWAEDLVRAVGLPAGTLPPIQPGTAVAGNLTAGVARATGLRPGLPVAVGGPDGTVGAVGAGMVRPGVAVDVMGTSDVFLVATDRPRFHPRGATLVNAHVLPGLWAAGGPMTTTGGALQWMAEALLGCTPDEVSGRLAGLEEAAQDLPPGAEGLFGIPSLVGERAPFWDPDMRAAFIGLGLGHRAEHLYRALVEGAAFLLRTHLEALQESGAPVDEVILAGGGSRSRLACQVRADVLGRPVALCPVQETTALGAAILVAVAIGHFPSAQEAGAAMRRPGEVITPNPARHQRYSALHRVFQDLHLLLRQRRPTTVLSRRA